LVSPAIPVKFFGYTFVVLHFCRFNPIKSSVIRCSHFECSVPYSPNLPFSISDLRALLTLRAERQIAQMSEIENDGLGPHGIM